MMTWLFAPVFFQSPSVLNPQYRVGEEESWRLSMAFGTEYGDIEARVSIVRKVRRVDDSGDVDFEYVFKDLKVTFNGQDTNPAPLPPLVLRMTNLGLPVGQKAVPAANSLNLVFLRYLHLLPQKDWRLGERVSVFLRDPGNSRTEVRGEMVAESVEKREAKTVAHLDLAIEGFSKALRLVRTAWFDLSSGRLVRAEGVVSNLPSAPGVGEIRAIQYRYERFQFPWGGGLGWK